MDEEKEAKKPMDDDIKEVDGNERHAETKEESNKGEKPAKSEEIDLKVSKKGILISLIVVIVLLLGVFIWQTGFYKKIYAYVMPATLDVTVLEKDTNKAIADVAVTAGDKTGKTNAEGKATITGLSVRQIKVAASATGYVGTEQTLKLKRKGNSLNLTLTINIEKTNFVGKISDFVNDQAVAGVTVTIGEKTTTTDASGGFTITDLPTGEQTIALAKDGYNAKSIKDTVVKDKPAAYALTAVGKVYFISNRDSGNRGIYICNYDGTETVRLVKGVADTEDYDLTLSPDKTKIAFLSTRESRKNSSNATVPDLYIINVDGTKLTKIDQSFNIYSLSAKWSSDSKYFVWSSQPVEKEYTYYVNSYNVKTGKSERLNTNGTSSDFVLSYDGTKVAWSQSTINANPTSVAGIFYRNLSGGDAKQVADKSSYDMSFSNNGSLITFSYWDSVANVTKNKSYTIATEAVADYTPEANKNAGKVLSADKKYYAYASARDGKTDVYISDVDGKNERKITALGTVTTFTWELNSRYILFTSVKTAETARYIVDITGGDPKKITDEYATSDYRGM